MTPIRVGLTGSVAAGKSVVGRLFETWGATRLDADVLAREAVEPGSPGLHRLREAFGERILAADGSLDRAAMRQVAFSDDEARATLEAIVHAEIRALRRGYLAAFEEAGVEIVVEEIPLLFETGLEDDYDAIVVVDADVAVRAARAEASRGWTREEFDSIDASQLDPAEKRRRATHVIVNDDDLEAVYGQAKDVWEALVACLGDRP